jgi:hypothetical protein
MKKNLVKVRDVLPVQRSLPVEPVPLENEPPHRKIARLTWEHSETTTALQELKRSWAERNIKAQACRQAVSTPEVTHFENEKRELAHKIQALQTEIGATNKEIRERKAERQTNSNGSKHPPQQKTRPFAADLEFETYFRLAAHSELAPALYAQIERCAKSMIADARRMGVE